MFLGGLLGEGWGEGETDGGESTAKEMARVMVERLLTKVTRTLPFLL